MLLSFFAVPPSKPVILLAGTGSLGQSVEGYLGPYQIGTRLSLVCQVNGGKTTAQIFLLQWKNHGSNLTLVVAGFLCHRFIPDHKLCSA